MPYYLEVAQKKLEDIFLLAAPFYLGFNAMLLIVDLVKYGFSFRTLSLVSIIIAVCYQYRAVQNNQIKLARLRERIERDIEKMQEGQIRELMELLDSSAIGDISCDFNAVSEHLQCSVNPAGDCKTCEHYEPRGGE